MAGFKSLSLFALAALISLCVPGQTAPATGDTEVNVNVDSSSQTDYSFDSLQNYLKEQFPDLASETKSVIDIVKQTPGGKSNLLEKALEQNRMSANEVKAVRLNLVQSALKNEENPIGSLLEALDNLLQDGKISEQTAVKIADLAEEANLQNKSFAQGKDAVNAILKSAVSKNVISEDDSNKIKEAYAKASTNVDKQLEEQLLSNLSKLGPKADTVDKKLEELEKKLQNDKSSGKGSSVTVSNKDTDGDGKADNVAVSVNN